MSCTYVPPFPTWWEVKLLRNVEWYRATSTKYHRKTKNSCSSHWTTGYHSAANRWIAVVDVTVAYRGRITPSRVAAATAGLTAVETRASHKRYTWFTKHECEANFHHTCIHSSAICSVKDDSIGFPYRLYWLPHFRPHKPVDPRR